MQDSSYILGIESTCDETGASVVLNGQKILSNEVSSSAKIHEEYGGVFPELACREHIKVIDQVVENALENAGCTPSMISAIAIAKGPGLIGALLIGMHMAKGLSIAWKKPLIGVNHVEAHLVAAMMSTPSPPRFPSLGMVISGGHTFMILMRSIGSYEMIGTTVDDAIGEAFDKVGKLLSLPYPGGAPLEELARKGRAIFPFKAGSVKKNPFYFSFSGLKTAVFYATKDKILSDQERADIAASFQKAAFSDLVKKAKKALEFYQLDTIYLGGGVANNLYLKELFHHEFSHVQIFWPKSFLTLDNAVMIAGLGFYKFLDNPLGDGLNLDVETRIPIA